MWTPEAVYELIKNVIIAYYVATFIFTILMSFVAAMMSNDD